MSSNATAVSDVRLATGSAADRATGLLGYISCTLAGHVRLDGITLRRTLDGRLTLSFPKSRGRTGRRANVRPLNDAARLALEVAVIGELRRQGILPR